MRNLLMDTNILLLFVIGKWNEAEIPRFRRTATFSSADFTLLENEAKRYQSVITVPAILTEVSDLMGNAFHETIASTIVAVGKDLQERSPAKDLILEDDVFDRLGFADV